MGSVNLPILGGQSAYRQLSRGTHTHLDPSIFCPLLHSKSGINGFSAGTNEKDKSVILPGHFEAVVEKREYAESQFDVEIRTLSKHPRESVICT